MTVVHGLTFYLGKSPMPKNVKAAQSLPLTDKGLLAGQMRRSLLQSQDAFTVNVCISNLPPIGLAWTGIGQTAAAVVWHREGRVAAASILLNGLELDQETKAIAAHFRSLRLPLPASPWSAIAKQPRPLLPTVHYNLQSFTDPVTATAAGALANAFFTMFGTSEA